MYIARTQAEKRELEDRIKGLEALIELMGEDQGKEQDKPNGPAPERYHGCYNVSGRRSRLRYGSDAVIILGGATVLAEILGALPDTVAGWRNYLPKRYKERLEKLLEERGYKVDRMIWR